MMKSPQRFYNISTITFVILFMAVLMVNRLIYNKFVDEEHFLLISKSRVEIELQRRHDLIISCMNAVRQHMQIEGEIQRQLVRLNGLIETRTNIKEQTRVENDIMKLLTNMNVLAESYPELKSNNPYLAIMKNIQDAGARVTKERLYLNKRIYEYNMMLKIFPFNLFAKIYMFKQEPFFEAVKGASIVPSFKNLYKTQVMSGERYRQL